MEDVLDAVQKEKEKSFQKGIDAVTIGYEVEKEGE